MRWRSRHSLKIHSKVGESLRCAYTILLMAVYWLTEALPLPITSMIPMVLLPLLGIMSTGEIRKARMLSSSLKCLFLHLVTIILHFQKNPTLKNILFLTRSFLKFSLDIFYKYLCQARLPSTISTPPTTCSSED